jgi:hypothetical protein
LPADDDSARCLATTLLTAGARRLNLSFLPWDDSGFRALREEALARGFRALREEALARGFCAITRPFLQSAYVSTQGPWSCYETALRAKLRSEI